MLALLPEPLSIDPQLHAALGTPVVAPAAAGLSFGQAVGAAWSARDEDFVLVAPASELRAAASTALAGFAVAERLARLAVVVLGDCDDVGVELAVRGFACESVGSTAQLPGALARARGRGRPAVIFYCGASRPAPLTCGDRAFRAESRPGWDLGGVGAERTPPARAPLAVPFEGPARDLGAFAAGVALRRIPLAVVPLADADALKPALRLGLPMIFVATEDEPPRDALWSLRLVPGVEVWRPAGAVEAGAILDAAVDRAGPTVVVLGPDPSAASPPDPLAGAAVLLDAPAPAATLLATGAEVALALAARAALECPVRVVAVSCVSRFAAVSDLERRRLLGGGPLVVLEAGVAAPWRALVGPEARILADDLSVAAVLAAVRGNGRAARSYRQP
jgi:hypothetical protein